MLGTLRNVCEPKLLVRMPYGLSAELVPFKSNPKITKINSQLFTVNTKHCFVEVRHFLNCQLYVQLYFHVAFAPCLIQASVQYT